MKHEMTPVPLPRETLAASLTNILTLLLACDSFSPGSQERFDRPVLLITYQLNNYSQRASPQGFAAIKGHAVTC